MFWRTQTPYVVCRCSGDVDVGTAAAWAFVHVGLGRHPAFAAFHALDGKLHARLPNRLRNRGSGRGCVVHVPKYTTIVLYMQGQNVSYFEAFTCRADDSIMPSPALCVAALALGALRPAEGRDGVCRVWSGESVVLCQPVFCQVYSVSSRPVLSKRQHVCCQNDNSLVCRRRPAQRSDAAAGIRPTFVFHVEPLSAQQVADSADVGTIYLRIRVYGSTGLRVYV